MYQSTMEAFQNPQPNIGFIQYQPKLASNSHAPQWSVSQPQGSPEIHVQPNP
jgi:hypothetical protein